MRYKLTVLLLLLNAAILIIIFQMDRKADSARAFQEQNSLVLPTGSIEQAEVLDLDGPGVPAHWQIRRQGSGDWRMVNPQQWAVNSYAVANILDQLRFMRMETRFPVDDVKGSGMSLADYGLDNPTVVLRISSSGGNELLLRIGAPTKVGSRMYVLSPDGKEIFVTSRDVLRALLVKLEDLRDNRIFNIPTYMVSSISLQRADGARVRLTKLGIGWEFESPIRVDADSDSVESLLADMSALKVKSFTAQDPAAQGLISPRLRVVLEADDARQSLLIGQSAGDGIVFAKLENSPEVFTLDESILERLQQAQEALRERHFNRLNKTDLSELRIQMGDTDATLQKLETGEWQVLRQSEAEGVQIWKADATTVSDLIESLDGLYSLRFVSDAPSEADLQNFGFTDPQRTVSLQFSKSGKTLVFGALEPEMRGVYVKTVDDPFVYEVSDSILAKLDPSPLHYRTRALESLPPAARITRLRLIRLADNWSVLDVGPESGQGWDSVLNGHSQEETAALTTMLDYARAGYAGSFIAAGFQDPMPLGGGDTIPWEWRMEADVELPSGSDQSAKRTVSYVFTDSVGGTTQYGGSRQLGLMFTLPQNMVDAVHTITFNRQPPAPQQLPARPQEDNDTTKEDVQEQEQEAAPQEQ